MWSNFHSQYSMGIFGKLCYKSVACLKISTLESEAYLRKYQFQVNISFGNFFHVIIQNDGADSNYDFELRWQCLAHRYNLLTNLLGYTVFISLFRSQNESNIQNDAICLPDDKQHSSSLRLLLFHWLLEYLCVLFSCCSLLYLICFTWVH